MGGGGGGLNKKAVFSSVMDGKFHLRKRSNDRIFHQTGIISSNETVIAKLGWGVCDFFFRFCQS